MNRIEVSDFKNSTAASIALGPSDFPGGSPVANESSPTIARAVFDRAIERRDQPTEAVASRERPIFCNDTAGLTLKASITLASPLPLPMIKRGASERFGAKSLGCTPGYLNVFATATPNSLALLHGWTGIPSMLPAIAALNRPFVISQSNNARTL